MDTIHPITRWLRSWGQQRQNNMNSNLSPNCVLPGGHHHILASTVSIKKEDEWDFAGGRLPWSWCLAKGSSLINDSYSIVKAPCHQRELMMVLWTADPLLWLLPLLSSLSLEDFDKNICPSYQDSWDNGKFSGFFFVSCLWTDSGLCEPLLDSYWK